MKSSYLTQSPAFWAGLIATITLVVFVRELALYLCALFGMPSAANVAGLVALFLVLIAVRWARGELPNWLSSSASTLLVDSGFAFLPVSAGAGILLFGLGGEFAAVCAIIIISVIVPLWAFAKLADKWLNDDSEQGKSHASS